ncbi:brefeldin A-inhibited guanine nucleotide-exchange protein 1-like [Xenia sp. Carnegie-2017]|uniref:brefeldin A-inhibited guanine nucleotide-exchange protein 1-like n=1 Tax=Xenia sp. Carnegie-2017 TaxID=2897299 RepID=UPI001F03BD57|nr:brefeldin A-inhibited guanine nucleotide-exchange protein 1-like [Xenia sp. Carnegie-2017]
MIGELIGDPGQYEREIMYAYIDQLDFTGTNLVQALRLLPAYITSGFPVKRKRSIDSWRSLRVGSVKRTQNAAYVLAYSIIMLTTDLHSSQMLGKGVDCEV